MLLGLLGLGFVGLLVWRAGWKEILTALRATDPGILPLLLSLQVITLLLCAGQLWYVLRCSGIELPFFKVFAVYMTGSFVESVTPSLKFGGEATKVYLLKQQTRVDYQRLTGAFVVYKLLSLTSFVLLFVLSAGVLYRRMALNLLTHAVTVLVLLAALGGCLLMGRSRAASEVSPSDARGVSKVRRFISQSLYYARTSVAPRHIATMLAVWICIWLLYPTKLMIVALSLGLRPAMVPLAASLYAGYVVSMLPLAPGGLGSFEGSLVFLLGRLAIIPQTALAMVLILRLATYWFPLLPAGYCARRLLLLQCKQPEPQPISV